jgi:hypothetical protein
MCLSLIRRDYILILWKLVKQESYIHIFLSSHKCLGYGTLLSTFTLKFPRVNCLTISGTWEQEEFLGTAEYRQKTAFRSSLEGSSSGWTTWGCNGNLSSGFQAQLPIRTTWESKNTRVQPILRDTDLCGLSSKLGRKDAIQCFSNFRAHVEQLGAWLMSRLWLSRLAGLRFSTSPSAGSLQIPTQGVRS